MKNTKFLTLARSYKVSAPVVAEKIRSEIKYSEKVIRNLKPEDFKKLKDLKIANPAEVI